MARDGSGTYSLPQAAFVSGTTIESAKVNSNFSDLASAMTASVAKDGQTVPTANLPMGNFKHTGVADGSSRTDYASLGQVAKGSLLYAIDTGSATAYAIAPSPGIAAYVVGYLARFKATNANSGTTPTLAVNSLAAGTITWPNGAALVAGDIPADAFVECICTSTTPTWHLQTVSKPPLALASAVNQSTTGPTYQEFTSGTAATYTTPAGAKSLRVIIVGGGGGGGGTGASTGPAGSVGGTTTFNSITAIGGGSGAGGTAAATGSGGSGGTGGSGTAIRINGGMGCAAPGTISVALAGTGGAGGGSAFFGGGGGPPHGNATGNAGATNTGGGGSGASGSASFSIGGAGGGGGEYAEFIINNPSATYTYTVGAGGAGGIGTGSGAATGGAGAAGRIIVFERYNY